MFAEQVGVVQEKLAPGGEDVSGKLKATPEQVPFPVRLVVRSGMGWMVTANVFVGLGLVLQFVFVPYTVISPEVAFAAKLTVTEGSDGVPWIIVAPVPV
jgi:hypothetical protein